MRLGLVADVHEDVDNLRWALELFHGERVDQIVFLGDAMVLGERIDETCRVLSEAGVVGVWGNHELGLAYEPDARARAKYAPAVIDFMTTLKPRMEIGECHFSHVEPWLDPHDPAQINYYDGPPDSAEGLARIFSTGTWRIHFGGHYHQWMLATLDGIQPWSGEHPVRLDQGRHFVTIRAACLGSCAIHDTDSHLLTPFSRSETITIRSKSIFHQPW